MGNVNLANRLVKWTSELIKSFILIKEQDTIYLVIFVIILTRAISNKVVTNPLESFRSIK